MLFPNFLFITMSGSSIYGNIDRAITESDGTQKDLLTSYVSVSVFMFFYVVIRPFRVPCTICKYLGLVVTMLNYIATILTLSTMAFLSHLFTMQPDDMVICFLNVRGLSNHTKRRETFLWLKKKKFSMYFL